MSPRMIVRPSLRRGLTLIDIVITVLVLGVLSAVAAPRFGGMMNRYRVAAAAQRLQADLEHARHQAQARGRPQAVRFDEAENRYELPGVADPDRGLTDYVISLSSAAPGVSLQSVSFGSSGDTAITFDLYGRPDFAGSVVLESGAEQRTVRVDGTTGRVIVE